MRLLPLPAIGKRGCLPVDYVTIAGRVHAQMLRESVYSLARSWPRLPRLVIVSDGTLEFEQLRRDLAFWPGTMECLDWRDLLPPSQARCAVALRTFAEREPMGRKLVAILGAARRRPTLYCDVDLLWFRHPPMLDGLLKREAPVLTMSADFEPAYDPALLTGAWQDLADPPYYCAGALFAKGDLLACVDVAPQLEYAAHAGVPVTEQTIMAGIARRLGEAAWPADEIALAFDDRVSLLPSLATRGWSARHYVGQVRHLFWRDALARRYLSQGAAGAALSEDA